MLLLFCLLFLVIAFIPINSNLSYYPEFIERSTRIGFDYYKKNIFGLIIPFTRNSVELLYSQKNQTFVHIKNSNGIKFDIIQEAEFVKLIIENKKNDTIIIPFIERNIITDLDGFPEQMKLTDESDKDSFRKWFCSIAMTQLYHADDRWVDRDCAGLIRYCTREALKKHDSRWLAEKKLMYDINISDVKKYNYPDVPLVGEKIFRIKSGDNENYLNVDSSFSEFAEAKYLISYNYEFISKDYKNVLSGDILFFSNSSNIDWPFHSMIFLGKKVFKNKSSDDYVIYHTGPSSNSEGLIKCLTISDLNKHPNKRWHVVKDNPDFLGFFRWKVLK
jgi:uncharacterized protein YfaT (DUF1175 family)